MSWIVNLAGKAEDLLNKIDSETASILTKELQGPVQYNQADHKRSNSYTLSSSSSVPSNLSEVGKLGAQSLSSSFRESGSLSSSPRKKLSSSKGKHQEQSFIDFLNDNNKKSTNSISLQVAQSNNTTGTGNFQSEIGHSRQSSISSGSSFLAVSGRETPGFSTLELDTQSGGSHSSDAYINVEGAPEPSLTLSTPSSFNSNDSEISATASMAKEPNARHSDASLLRKEVASLNQEMSQVLRRAKEAEKECERYKEQISTLALQQRQSEALLRDMQERETELQNRLNSVEVKYAECDNRISERERTNKELQEQNQRLLQGADMTNNMHSEMVSSLQEKLREVEQLLSKEKDRHTTTDRQLTQRISLLEDDQKTLSRELSEAQRKTQEDKTKISSLNNQIMALKSELSGSQNELSDYKGKAGRILQSKDLLIESLKKGRDADGENVHAEEVEQLRSERDLLREELSRSTERAKHLSEEILQNEALTQQENRDTSQRVSLLHEELAREQGEGALLQEEMKQTKQELRSLQEEMTRQKVNLTSRIQERDSEIQRLQKQIAHKQSSCSSSAELETRIHGLTESLIHKQTTIESLSTDKHTLQIQLEKLQQQYNESQSMLNKDPVIDFQQEEVRNRVPSFLVESPFDGGVTRRVKKAYGSLDKFSVRLGVFLRRYPIARVFVLLYMALLHAWVMIVLLTYKPEVHGSDFIHPGAMSGGTAPRSPP